MTLYRHYAESLHWDNKSQATITPSPQGENRSKGYGRRNASYVEKNQKLVRVLKYSAVAVPILAILGAGLFLAYMHLSGLGITKAGFAKLGHQISALSYKPWTKFVDVLKAPAHLNVGEIIGIAIGCGVAGVVALVGLIKLCDKISEKRKSERFHRLLIDDHPHDDSPNVWC